MTREILTLQIGNQSNHIGVHFWNQLEYEFNHQNTHIDYNTYFTFDKKTNLPTARVLICDYRNTFGCLLEENQVKFDADSSVEVINRTKDENSWAKKLKTRARFHEKSLIPLRDYWYTPNSEENQFDIYPIGQETFRTNRDLFENSMHFLLESCDSLQSFRCLYDVNNSFSGVFSSIQDYLHDECPKQPIWSFPVGKPTSLFNQTFSVLNSMNENQMPTIISPENLDPYHSSLAIQHSLYSSLIPLDVLADRLCPSKQTLLRLFSKIPLDLHSSTLMNYLEKTDIFSTLNPSAAHLFIRGIDQKQLYNQSVYKFNIQTSGELIEKFLQEEYNSHMFLSTNSWNEKYDDMNLLAGLINDEKFSSKYFENLLNNFKKTNLKLISKRWQEYNFDEQIFEQLINDLNFLHEQYLP